MTFDPAALAVLQQSLTDAPPQGSFGRRPRAWFERVSGMHYSALPDTVVDRHAVRAFCANPQNSTWFCCALICAWGGLRSSHGKSLFGRFNTAEPALSALRRSTSSRAADYASLQDLKTSGNLPGVDVAFFTKFLFFLRPTPDAYILDQWTAKSINLLLGRPLIRLNGHYVATQTSPAAYDEFCGHIEALAPLINRASGAQAEEAIFSQGGRKAQAWRKHVRAAYRPA